MIRNVRAGAIIAVLACVLAFAPKDAAAKAWREIVPLHSTRADVERLLGPPNIEGWGFDLEGERALITYADRTGCEEGLPAGWNVPADTVVEISVSIGGEVTVGDVLVRGRTYDQIRAVRTPNIYYVDRQEGIRYSTIDGMVTSITYFGSEADDKKLRCGEYKYAAPVPAGAPNHFEQVPFDSYGRIPFEEAAARLDNFVIQLLELNKEQSNYRGFIIVYAGRSAYEKEAQSVAECSKNYLVKVRQADPESIVAVDAGHKEEFIVELYIMPNDAYPPMLLPTVSPRKTEMLEGEFKPCKKQAGTLGVAK